MWASITGACGCSVQSVAILWTVVCFIALLISFPARHVGWMRFIIRWKAGGYRINFDLSAAEVDGLKNYSRTTLRPRLQVFFTEPLQRNILPGDVDDLLSQAFSFRSAQRDRQASNEPKDQFCRNHRESPAGRSNDVLRLSQRAATTIKCNR